MASGKSLAERRAGPGGFGALTVEKAPKPSAAAVAGDRKIRVLTPDQSFEEEYDLQQLLHDVGSQTQVWKAICKLDGQDVIVKKRARYFAVGGEAVWHSLLTRMLNLDSHQNVLGLKEVVQDDKHYYIIMTRCSGGELFDFLQSETDSGGARNAGTPGTLRTARDVKDAQDVPERECKRIMREILEAVDHIHSRGLIHRDIKPENIMFHDTSNEPNSPKTQAAKKAVKLIDFDTCLEYEPQSPRAKHVVGTLGYLAPEALQGEYSPASDLWSVGVILYILMTGDMPFEQDMFGEQLRDTRCGSATMNSIYYKLKNANIDFECEPWPSFPQARDLCQQLLAFQPEDRSPSARAALNHPWLSGK
ncbi:unnamed protein product [Effrenium voratum]|uniref:Protein kinase domain-containing protein n=1 Tax=Effrenium voratum TaxID=2562239 RepID=A0AA36IMY7_9DINO|nr:unnamed protein product [Effrenium voratum]